MMYEILHRGIIKMFFFHRARQFHVEGFVVETRDTALHSDLLGL